VEARHTVDKYDPPRSPMDIKTTTKLLRGIIEEWIESIWSDLNDTP
jgi:hypothetical protein